MRPARLAGRHRERQGDRDGRLRVVRILHEAPDGRAGEHAGAFGPRRRCVPYGRPAALEMRAGASRRRFSGQDVHNRRRRGGAGHRSGGRAGHARPGGTARNEPTSAAAGRGAARAFAPRAEAADPDADAPRAACRPSRAGRGRRRRTPRRGPGEYDSESRPGNHDKRRRQLHDTCGCWQPPRDGRQSRGSGSPAWRIRAL
jgi:hypothetical protein